MYCDAVQVSLSPFDVVLHLCQRTTVPGAPHLPSTPNQVGCVRMSLEHAKVMSIVLRKSLKCFEDTLGCPIQIHPEACRVIGISLEEDW